jgi:phospholipid/cholesterol/gamma-HCH transport system permease protein
MDAAQAPTQRWQQQGAGWTLALAGDWRGAAASGLQAAPAALGALASGTLKVDAQALAEWDAGLAAALRDRLAPLARQGVTLQLEALPDDVRAVLELALPVPGSAAAAVPAEPPPSGLAALGQWVIERSLEAASTLAFFGEVLLALGRLLRGRSGLRGGELLRQIDQTGPLSIGIVALTCFLVGLMLAYMGGAQLDKLGAQAYIADHRDRGHGARTGRPDDRHDPGRPRGLGLCRPTGHHEGRRRDRRAACAWGWTSSITW